MKNLLTTALITMTIASFSFVTNLLAGIKCQDGQQIISPGKSHPSEYCELHQLAQVARSRGISTSFKKLLRDMGERREVCDMVGFDTRIVITRNPYHTLNPHENAP